MEKLPCSIRVAIGYTGAKGKSERQVDIRAFEPDPFGCFSGVCLLRHSVRTFKFQNVSDAVDVATGEVIEDLHSWLAERYRQDSAGELCRFIREYRPLLDVLIYMAACDGKILKVERRAIAHWLLKQTGLHDALLNHADLLIDDLPVPDLADFDLSVAVVSRIFPELKEELLLYATEIAMADKKIHHNEIDTLGRLRRLLV
nr:MAG TPA: hypothetical protein [Caudoviricetes sp.]DAS62920.1 MAG TPA: hypothetical protein [Caudoviricetes sp.]